MAIEKPTPELIQEICINVSAGMLPRAAAALAGVDRGDFSEWMRKAKKGIEPFLTLARDIDKAALTAQRRILASVSLAATRDPKLGLQFLALRHPEDWSERGRERPAELEVDGRSTEEIKALAARMASRFPLLHWEDRDEFEALIAGLLAEHRPEGPTEEHLVEELAAIVQRKNRFRLAEAATHRRGLKGRLPDHRETVMAALSHLGETKPQETVSDALTATDEDTAASQAIIDKEEAELLKVVKILESTKKDRYEGAQAALGDNLSWWTNALARNPREYEKEQHYKAEPDELLRFLTSEILTWYPTRTHELENRPLIRQQAFGEAFDAEKLEPLSRMEAFLDRKFTTTLDKLIQLQELRRNKAS